MNKKQLISLRYAAVLLYCQQNLPTSPDEMAENAPSHCLPLGNTTHTTHTNKLPLGAWYLHTVHNTLYHFILYRHISIHSP